MSFKRQLSPQGTVDLNLVQAMIFDLVAGGQGNLHVEGKLTILGALNAAIAVGPGALVRCWNNDTNPHYVAIGVAGMAAPTGAANGIAIPPRSYVTINTAESTHIRSDDANTFGYLVSRDSTLTVES